MDYKESKLNNGYKKHLYSILYPNQALIASHLTPKQLAEHFVAGSSKYFDSKIIFAEIDVEYRNDYFNIDEVLSGLAPHPDGRPKATRYISSYRVLEHLELDAFKNLYLTSPSGSILELKQGEDTSTHQPGFIRTFAHICPNKMLVLTKKDATNYGQYLVGNRAKGTPKLLYTQVTFDVQKFMNEIEVDPFATSPFSFVHSSKLRDAVVELGSSEEPKDTKGISLNTDIGKISYKRIRHGWWLSGEGKTLFYPMPHISEIERNNFGFARDM